MTEIEIPLAELRACWRGVEDAARAIGDAHLEALHPDAMPGSATARVLDSDPWGYGRDAVAADMHAWVTATRTAVDRCLAADHRTAAALPLR
jgi:hypothetical protein